MKNDRGRTARATPTPADPPATPSEAVSPWRRPAVRIPIMVVGFTVVMILVNAVAAALQNPVAALLLGPALGAGTILLYRLAVRLLERRPVNELARRGAISAVARGLLIGTALAAASIGVIALAGGFRIVGWGSVAGALTTAGIMCAVAVSEETLFRGVIFRFIEAAWGTWIALGASAVAFGLIHLVNPGATLWGALAVAVEAGLLLAAAFVATRSLWLPIGLHMGWNITTVGVFGTIGSGGDVSGALFQAAMSGPVWLTGGDFGPEASVFAILVCLIGTALFLRLAHRRGRMVPARRRPTRSLALPH